MAQGRSVNKKTSVFSSNDAVCRPEPWRFERRVTHQSATVGAHVRQGAALLRDARREDHRRRSVHRYGPFIDVELQLIRRRSRAGVVEMVNLSAYRFRPRPMKDRSAIIARSRSSAEATSVRSLDLTVSPRLFSRADGPRGLPETSQRPFSGFDKRSFIKKIHAFYM